MNHLQNPAIAVAVSELKREFASAYGERLRGMFLFGSFARGDFDDESDVDLLVVLDEVSDYWSEVTRTIPVVARLSQESGRTITPVFVSESMWLGSSTNFISNVREEAVPA